MMIIYLSGIDGCGKTTQSQLLQKYLARQGVPSAYAWLRWDPSFRKLFVLLRALLGKTKKKESLSRAGKEQIQHSRWISLKKSLLSNTLLRRLWWSYACCDYSASLKKNLREVTTDVIIVDRYLHDFVIDQAVNLGIPPEGQADIIEKMKNRGFRFPDLTIIIDMPAEVGYNRKLDGTPLDYLKEREARYKVIPGNDRTLLLDGTHGVDSLANSIALWVSERLVTINH